MNSEFCESATSEALLDGYGVFKEEALELDPTYQPTTVNTDGWDATQAVWKFLFPTIALIRCFLHMWLRIRDRSKSLKEMFFEIGKRVWSVYGCQTQEAMSLAIKDLRIWAKQNLTGVVLDKVLDLCGKTAEWSLHYVYRGCARTSNMLDRLMRFQCRFFVRGQAFHGGVCSAKLRCRSHALLYNYRDWCPRTRKLNNGIRCPAERINKKRYAKNWLE
ncbi:MAG: hypothetical protein LBQ66_13375, partial [Planctomycetaceae bacterium]|nr:hypothetical protein [Planctomycetaceae bacterium]